MEEIFLPNEVVIQIISHLKVPDVRSCRLVCRSWRSCCEDKVITRKEKFVFHPATHLTSEINDFLNNLERSRVNVQLNKIDLKELNFKAYGAKIQELEMMNCLVDENTLTHLFYFTPNMTRVKVRLDVPRTPHAILFSDNTDFNAWKASMYTLHTKEQLQHPNLTDFECNLYEIEQLTGDVLYGYTPRFHLDDKFLAHVFFVFPGLRNIHFGNQRWLCDTPIMKKILPKTSITKFEGMFEINFDKEDQLEAFASLFPRLKSLQLAIKIAAWKSSSSSLCERFFSLLPDLELLNLKCEIYDSRDHAVAVKKLLFQTLKNCLKLRELSLKLESCSPPVSSNCPGEIMIIRRRMEAIMPRMKPTIHLYPEDIPEFSYLITRIKTLRIPEMVFKLESNKTAMATLPNTKGLVEDLRFTSESTKPCDVRHLIINTYQLTILCLHLEGNSLTMNFEKILQSQKCLQRLTFITLMKISEATILQIKSNEVTQLKHERLNHLHYVFLPKDENYPIDYFVKRLCLWEFPNLSTLLMTSGADLNSPELRSSEVATPELENIFKEWIGRMKTLTLINVHMYRGLLNFQDFVQVCGMLPRLQGIMWTGQQTSKPSKEDIINFFENHPNLRDLSYPRRDEACYKYSRSKKQLFQVIADQKVKDSTDLVLVE